MSNPNPENSLISQVAQQRFDNLLEVIKLLQTDRDSRRGGGISSGKARRENARLNDLLSSFERVASEYFNKGKQLITAQPFTPTEQARAFESILRPLDRHTLQLLDLVRPQLQSKQRPQLQPGQNKSSLTDKRSWAQAFISIIMQRPMPFRMLGNNLQFIITSESYQLIHFNYYSRVIIMGVPLSVFAGNRSKDFCVLWHETAGALLARARYFTLPRKDDGDSDSSLNLIESWVVELESSEPTVWRCLSHEYKKSLIATAVVEFGEIEPPDAESDSTFAAARRQAIQSGKISPYEVSKWQTIKDELNKSLDLKDLKSLKWRADWLSEFIEDLFGVQALGGFMIEALADALVRAYDKLEVGDSAHPPGRLRLQVALAYLELLAKDISEEEMASQSLNVSATITNINDRYPHLVTTPDKAKPTSDCHMQDLAQKIANFYHKNVIGAEHNSLSEGEKKLAEALLQAKQFQLELGLEDGKKGSSEHLIVRVESQPPIHIDIDSHEEALLPIQVVAGDQDKNQDQLLDKMVANIQACKNLVELKQIRFAEVDAVTLPYPPILFPPST